MLIKLLIVSSILINGYKSRSAEYCHCEIGCVSITYNIDNEQRTTVKCVTEENETCEYYTTKDPNIISCSYRSNELFLPKLFEDVDGTTTTTITTMTTDTKTTTGPTSTTPSTNTAFTVFSSLFVVLSSLFSVMHM
ncbi:uncharacterized protein LOC143199514 [Rhynchophorus ferrugineus]|uniref:uncharacterized protein LOC143199514 n=1 Tax=Rhynchophorus ferrugineus TaxID=354439 RepID=UPI003FCC9006